jgi:ribonuclease Z
MGLGSTPSPRGRGGVVASARGSSTREEEAGGGGAECLPPSERGALGAIGEGLVGPDGRALAPIYHGGSTNSTGCDVEICFLGTASCVPSLTRSVSCVAVRYTGDIWLFDVGEGSQVQIQRSQIKPSRISKIFITHAHGDHSFGLPGILCLMGMEREQFEGRPVEVYGPEGLRMFLRTVIRFTISRIVPPYVVHEIKQIPNLHKKRWSAVFDLDPQALPLDSRFGEVAGGRDIYPTADGVWDLLEDENVKIQAAPMVHTVPCVGYVMTEKDRAGRLRAEHVRPIVERNREALRAQGMDDPNKIFRALKGMKPGDSIKLPDGTVLRGEDIMEANKPGRKVAICGDTSNAGGLAQIARDCDVLVHESTNAFLPPFDKGTYLDVQNFAIAHGHSTPQMAGAFARAIGAKRLILTHFSPRYKGDLSPESLAIMKRLEDMARKTSQLASENVIAAHDLMIVGVPSRKSTAPEAEAEAAS